ncbi:MAG TPA: alpha-L-fucosidase [Verrucomicrobiae bacterium]|nr:alpha-L-fucosidase [Verrucomicrobiae bacterium]
MKYCRFNAFPAFAALLLSIFESIAQSAPPSPGDGAANVNWANYNFNLPSKDSPRVQWWRDSRTNLDQRLAWWREARFGMFIHWGVYSYAGGAWHGKPVRGYAEHIQRIMKIPGPVYRREIAGHFDPTNFDADAWVRLAKAAGMKYIVITAKHHDGFAMWPTKVNDYNVMDATPWHHDPMKDLKAACQKYGLKFGFYYSQAFDWADPDAPGNDWDRNNPGGDRKIGGQEWWKTRPEFMNQARRYVDEKAIPQLLELIHDYHPDLLWFDTASKLPPSENLRIMKAVREADPNVVISGRLVHDWGDYADTTDRPANFPPYPGDWEGIPTTDESYGWNQNDFSYKPPSHFIQLLAKAAARGGNLLLNIGPMGNGEFDPHDVAILQGIAKWWRVNGQSIRGTTRTPLPVQTWGESTRKGNALYLHVFNWPTNGQLVIGGLVSDVNYAALLANKSVEVDSQRINPFDMELDGLPAVAPDTADSVIEIKCDGPIQTDTNRLLQPQFPADTLRAFDGVLHGKLRYGPGKKTDDYVMNWKSPGESVSWPVRLNEPAKYEVLINYVATENSAGGTFAVKLGTQTLNGMVKAGNPQVQSLGAVSLNSGPFEISVSPVQIVGDELFRLRNLELKTVR